MRKTVIGAAAAAIVTVAGAALAQERQSGQEQKLATSQTRGFDSGARWSGRDRARKRVQVLRREATKDP